MNTIGECGKANSIQADVIAVDIHVRRLVGRKGVNRGKHDISVYILSQEECSHVLEACCRTC